MDLTSTRIKDGLNIHWNSNKRLYFPFHCVADHRKFI